MAPANKYTDLSFTSRKLLLKIASRATKKDGKNGQRDIFLN
jgi:hypothetical protein